MLKLNSSFSFEHSNNIFLKSVKFKYSLSSLSGFSFSIKPPAVFLSPFDSASFVLKSIFLSLFKFSSSCEISSSSIYSTIFIISLDFKSNLSSKSSDSLLIGIAVNSSFGVLFVIFLDNFFLEAFLFLTIPTGSFVLFFLSILINKVSKS